jgi:hypothetical protein
MTDVIEKVALTAEDRCDRCTARALVRAKLKSGELYFCGHHARETGYTLVLQAVEVYDPEGLLHYEDR